MNQKQTIDWIAQQLKGESAFWYNNRSGIPGPKLQWQDDYFVESVSPAQVPEQTRPLNPGLKSGASGEPKCK